MRIAILCNDRLALPALSQLVQSGMVVSVGTTDHMNEIQLLIQQICSGVKVPVQQFAKKKFEADLNTWLLIHQPDVVLVKTFPWLIPSQALGIPKKGFINFHYAPLPQWRGSNPLFWMIRNRALFGGVTVHQMSDKFDEGDILLYNQIPLSPETTFGLFCTQLAYSGLDLTAKLLQGLQANTLKPVQQDQSKAKWYGRPKPGDLFIDWETMTSEDISSLVKACNPWNKGAATRGNGWTFGVTDASFTGLLVPENTLPGTILELDDEKGLIVACCNKKAIKLNIIYCEEGFFQGKQLSFFGFKKGNCLGK